MTDCIACHFSTGVNEQKVHLLCQGIKWFEKTKCAKHEEGESLSAPR